MKLLTMLLAGTVAFGTAAAPLTAMAATSGSYSITQPGTVNATKNVAYKISGVTKKQYAVVRVRGAAKTEVTVSKGSKNITSAVRSKSGYKMKGTGSTLSFKIKAKKTAVNKKYKVNVKIYNSASKKLVKKVSATSKVLVAATSVSLDSTTLSLKEGESKTLSYTLKPATSTDSVTYTSTNKTVAEVDNTGKVTAVAAGSATITATTTSGKTAICTVNVTAAQTPDDPSKPDDPAKPDDPSKPDDPDVVVGEAANITAEVSNALTGYEDTVLATSKAEVLVKVTDKDGNPVADKYVMLTTEDGVNKVDCVTDQNVKTGSDGTAAFVLAAHDDADVASCGYTVKAVGSNVEAKGSVKFAVLSLSQVKVAGSTRKTDANYGKLKVGVNAEDAWAAATTSGSRNIQALNGTAQYVSSQQVSTAGTDEHAVTLEVEPQIRIPAVQAASGKVQTYVQEVTEEEGTSGSYSTYSDVKKTVVLEKDSAGIKTATLNFNYIKMSDYSTLTIRYYSALSPSGEPTGELTDEKVTIDGAADITGRSYQVPVSNGIKAVVVELTSEGQVQTDANGGFSIKDITYTYTEAGTGEAGSVKPLEGASVTWEAVTPNYTADKVLTAQADFQALGFNNGTSGLPNDYDSNHTYTYKIPVFPYTGNAVITETDSEKNVVAYYLAPVTNDIKDGEYTNTNIMAALDDEAHPDAGCYAYKASSEEVEALASGFEAKNDGKTVVVNSEKSGCLNLKGTVKMDGMGAEELDAASSAIYTSVQYNPTPDRAVTSNDAFLALAGQSVKATAQLVDKNGNKVSTSGQTITFENTSINGATLAAGSVSGTTDANGQLSVTYSAASSAQITGLKATTPGSDYKVVLTIGDRNVENADIYWVAANLSFTDSTYSGTTYQTTAATPDVVVGAGKIQPTVGQPWLYGVKTIGEELKTGELAGYMVDIDGLKVGMNADSANKGTYRATEKTGEMSAECGLENDDLITAVLNGSSATDNVTFTATKGTGANKVTRTFTSAGTGTPNLNARLGLTVDWQTEGKKIAFVNPMGTYGNVNDGKIVYIKVTDKTGNNPVKDAVVDVTLSYDAYMEAVDKGGTDKYQPDGGYGTYSLSATVLSEYKAAKAAYDADCAAYAAAKPAFNTNLKAYTGAVDALLATGTVPSDTAKVTAYTTAKTTLEQAAAAYLSATDAAIAAVNASDASASTKVTAVGTAKTAYTTALSGYGTAVTAALTDYSVTATDANPAYTAYTAAKAAFDTPTGGVATLAGALSVTGTSTGTTNATIVYTDGTEKYDNGSGDAIAAGWYVKTELETAKGGSGSSSSLTTTVTTTGLTIANQAVGDEIVIAADGSVTSFADDDGLTISGPCTVTTAQTLEYCTTAVTLGDGNTVTTAGWYTAASVAAAKATGGTNSTLVAGDTTGLSITGTPAAGQTLNITAYAESPDAALQAATTSLATDAATYMTKLAAYDAAKTNAEKTLQVKTDANGYAAIKVNNAIAASTVVTAKYDNQSQITTINWTDKADLAITDVKVTELKNIEVTFNNNLDAASVTKGMFVVTNGGTAKQISSVTVSGKKATIVLSGTLDESANLVIDNQDDTTSMPGVTLQLTDEFGDSLTAGNLSLTLDETDWVK